jgi:energy-coupling factor transport system permease protein
VRILGLTLVTRTGLFMTCATLTRFIGITLSFVAVFRSVQPDDLASSIRWFGAPYSASLVLIIALRYIPSLGATWRSVQDAHRLRMAPSGRYPAVPARFRPGRRLFRWDEHLPVLTSVLIQAVKGIPALAMALECRGFGRRTPRTSLALLKKGKALASDLLVCLGVSAFLLAPGFMPWPSLWLP